MKLKLLTAILLLAGVGTAAEAQQATRPPGRVSLQIHYGAVANFQAASFKDYSYELQHVRLLGTAGGGEIGYQLSPKSALALGYTRSVNMEQKHVAYQNSPGTFAQIDFRLRYINNAFQAVYERIIVRDLKLHAGLLYLTTASQSAAIAPVLVGNQPYISISEINRGNSYAEEGGVVAGLEYSRNIDTRLRLGLKARGYYLISVSTFEMLTLTPTLTYQL
ncbi:hypothetical protein [Hymenobacter lapidiphilus]|uniref:Outer membrane protein beta-barrel domain-containing protein n=1 Tax=Hymenobacter lapidiphilus TaxID=2608003 RepID=A0A7Y7PMT9_9BACT|nr:hypothetical protein [Hymenobacter lapidiphilus]NVO30694.1 hypothetical protein [Hymenobacter lapidiphilus]